MGFSGSIEQVKLNAVLGAKASMNYHNVFPSSTSNSLTITSNMTLSSDLAVEGDLTINSGITLTTNGYSIICSGTLTNNGTIDAGTYFLLDSGSQYSGASYGIYIQANQIIAGTINAVGMGGGGGQEGGGGGGAIILSYGSGGYTAGTYNVAGGTAGTGLGSGGGNGGATLVAGGTGSTAGAGGNGSTPSAPTLTNELIFNWYSAGMKNYLSGGGLASMNTTGISFTDSYGGSGGGTGTTANGNGGAGQVITYSFTQPPLSLGITSSVEVITTGKIQVVLQGIKLGSTLDNSIIQITITNTTTNNEYSFLVGTGQQFYYSFIDEHNISNGGSYQYSITTSTYSGTPSNPLYCYVEAREVL